MDKNGLAYNQEKTFKDYVESLCDVSSDIALSTDYRIGFFKKLVRERRELKTKFFEWFKKQI